MPSRLCRFAIGLGLGATLHATELWTEQNVPANFDLHGVAAARLRQPNSPDRSSFFIAGQGGVWRGDRPLKGEWELVLNEPGSRYRAVVGKASGLVTSVEAVGDQGKVTRSIDGENWNSTIIANAGNFTGLAADPTTGIVVAVE